MDNEKKPINNLNRRGRPKGSKNIATVLIESEMKENLGSINNISNDLLVSKKRLFKLDSLINKKLKDLSADDIAPQDFKLILEYRAELKAEIMLKSADNKAKDKDALIRDSIAYLKSQGYTITKNEVVTVINEEVKETL